MSRYCPHEITPVLEAAQRWKERALIGDGSVLSDDKLWTSEYLDELHQFFVQRPDASNRPLMEKLEDQLRLAKSQTKRLAAELLWVLYLFPVPAAMGADKKRSDIRAAWSWSGEQLPTDLLVLKRPLELGVGNPGTAYHTRRWLELAYLVEFGRRIKAEGPEHRRNLLTGDPWRAGEWLDSIETVGRRQLPHVLRFLLMPDNYERSSVLGDKRRILGAFRGISMRDLRDWPNTRLDRSIFELRQELETQQDTRELDFYTTPLVERWRARNVKVKGVRYWKVAPGDNARIWDKCRDGGFIAIGWDELGDITDLTKQAFNSRMSQVREKHPDWTTNRLEQVWKFAQITEGDRIVANRGTREVVGIGTVTGSYYFVEGEEYGHRLSVEWEDIALRSVQEEGWRRTLIELDEAQFERILTSSAATTATRYWLEKTHVFNRADRLSGEHALGQALWSPQLARNGSDIYGAMREVRPGDVVLHLTDNEAITGVSLVASSADPNFKGLEGTEWAGQPAFRIALRDFERATPPLPRGALLRNPVYERQLLNIAQKNAGLFYNSSLELNQRHYLTELPHELAVLMNAAYRAANKHDLPHMKGLLPSERTSWIFQANPKLFDIDRALSELAEIGWLVKQHEDSIAAGDHVYVWRSGAEAGVIGEMEVMDAPSTRAQMAAEFSYNVSDEKFEGEQLRVRCRVIRRLDSVISRQVLMNTPGLTDLTVLRAPQGTNFRLTNEQAEKLAELVRNAGEAPMTTNPVYTVEQLSEESGFPPEMIKHWVAQLERKKHFVLQGPPGTGKTYLAERLSRILLSGTRGIQETVQFHPSYAYEDFMQGIRPDVVDRQLSFKWVPGRFLEFCSRASALPDTEPCVMVIDELNRANLSRVFGELMYLLEYRDKEVPLAGGGKAFRVPRNVYIIGTMNTADRSIALVDHALRRRFAFAFLGPEYDVLTAQLSKHGLSADSLTAALRLVNKAIDNRNYELGISFFLGDGAALRQKMPAIWQGEIEPYLEEYFFDQPDKMAAFRWSKISATTMADWV